MSFLPSRMSRLLIGGHKARLEPVIEALHEEGILHIEDYKDPTGTTGIGTPLEAGDDASALLLRTRGLQKSLGSEGLPPASLQEEPARLVDEAQTATAPALDRLRALRESWSRIESDTEALRPLSGIDLDFAAASGLRSVKVLVGTTRTDPTAALAKTGAPHELQVAPSGSGFAVVAVVGTANAAAVERALSECGFSPLNVPAGSGTPAQRLSALAAERDSLAAQIATAEGDVAVLRLTWGPRLGAVEGILTGQVEKTQAPLKFAVTDTTFHIEGWVPRGRVQAVEQALTAKFGANVYFHDLGDASPLAGHGGGAGHGAGSERLTNGAHDGHAHASDGHAVHDGPAGTGHASEEHADAEHHADADSDPPVHLANPRAARPYEWMLTLLARPRYNEIDPSKLLLFFFPIFFGLMVGDVVTGLLVLLLGLWLRTHNLIGIGGPAVGKALIAGGIMAMLFGAFLYGEALGIPFVASPEKIAEGEASWAHLLNIQFHEGGLLHVTGEGPAEGWIPGGMLAPHSGTHLMLGSLALGVYSKLDDVLPLMIIAIAIAAVHMILGLALGVRNVKAAHGLRLAIEEKASVLGILLGGVLCFVGARYADAAGITTLGWGIIGAGLGLIVVCLGLLWVGAAKVYGDGSMAMGWVGWMELISFGGNFVSYTRLAAIGAAEAGLGLAVYTICFHTLPGGVVGWVLYLAAFAGLTLLSILSAGLQSLRLQFVEFFGKFFTGGGRPYVPFGRRAA